MADLATLTWNFT